MGGNYSFSIRNPRFLSLVGKNNSVVRAKQIGNLDYTSRYICVYLF